MTIRRIIGPMLHLIYPPRSDAVTEEMVSLVEERRVHRRELSSARAGLEALARRPEPLDHLADEL